LATDPHVAFFILAAALNSQLHADIPWPEVVQRLAYENDKLARRPQGHNGEYFVVCTLYYTPKESGFTFERGFDATPVTKPGLQGRKYPRDFLRSVKKEGFGRITTPLTGDITFATTAAIRTRLLHMRQVEAVFWCRVIRRRWWEGTVACVAERL
jgi:hypothetical protein